MASRSLGTLTLDLIARIGGFQQGMDQAARSAQNSMGRIERQVQSSSDSVVSSLKAIGAAAVAYLSARELVEYSQTWIGVQNRIKQVSDTYEQFAKQSQAVFQIAQNSQSGLDATAQLYQRIAASSGQLGTTQEKVAQVTQNISKAMSASGVSAEAAQGALVQLGQAFASGVLRGEELNSVLEQAPGLAQAIADGMGVARESLRTMGAEGKLTSKEVFGAILAQTQAIDDAFARSQTTLAGGFTVIENSAAKLVGSLDETLGVTKTIVQAMLDLSAAADSVGIKSLVDVLEAGLYVAIARVTAGLIGSLSAWKAARAAAAEQAFASSVAASGELRRAEATQVAAAADLAAARSAVAAATSRVAADRQLLATEAGRLQSVQSAIAAEKVLEVQRLQAQITDIGRQQSIARMVELRTTEIAITRQLTAVEAQLAATSVAGSAQMTAALAQRTAATEALAVANGHLTATQLTANAATTAAVGTWFSASTALGAGIATLRTAGAAILRMAAGWPGLILTMGALAYSFIDFGDKAETGANKAASAFEDASTRIRKSSRGMLPENLSTQSYDQLQKKLQDLQGDLKEAELLQERFQKGADNNGDVPFETPLADTKERVDSIRLAIQSVQKELNSARLSSDKDGSSYLKNLEKQAVVAGKLTEVEKLRAQIASGGLKFSAEDERKALAAAEAIDKVNAALKSSKASAKDDKALEKAFETAEEGYQRQIELINTTSDKRKNASEQDKLSFEISTGKLQGLNEQQRRLLEGLAAELDAKKALAQADADAKKLAAFSGNVDESNQSVRDGFDQDLAGAGAGDKRKARLQEMLAIEQDFNKQQRDLVLQRNSDEITQDLYDRQTEKLKEALATRLVLQQDYYNQLDASQANWMDGVSAAWQNYADEAKNYSAIAGDFVAGSLDDLQGGIGGAFSDIITGAQDAGDAVANLAGNMAKSVINALTDMAAQWLVYQAVQLLVGKTTQASAIPALVANATATSFQAQLAAFASTAAIPIIGPAMAPGAAAAAALATAPMVAGVASAALAGMAHDGIDSVPETGTWLLQKGERVTTAETSAKLDRTLERVSAGNGGSGAAPIVIHAPVSVQAQPGMSEADAAQQGKAAGAAFTEEIRSVLQREMRQGGLLWRRNG